MITLGLNSPSLEVRGNPLESPSVPLGSISALWAWISGSSPTTSGILIDEYNSLQIISVQAAVKLISQTVAGLPLKLYKKLPKGREEAQDNPLYDLLSLEPNPEQGAYSFWAAVVAGMALCGNAYILIQRVSGQVEALWILHPQKTKPIRLANGELAFETYEGANNGVKKIYPKADVLHFKFGVSFDGMLGMSPIQLAREELGLNKALLMTGSRIMQTGRPSGVMTTDNVNIDEKTLINLRESWQAAQTGSNSFKTAFLSHGFKYSPISLSLEDLEFVKTRIHSRTEVAALFNLSPHMLGDVSRLGGNNAEQENLNFLSMCLRSYICPIENEIQRVLLPRVGRNAGTMIVRFDVSELLRADVKTRNESYALARQWGLQTANEIRDDMEIPRVGPEADVLWMPVNMMAATNVLKPQEPEPVTLNKANPDAPTGPKQIEAPTEDTKPTSDERSMLEEYTLTFVKLFRDDVGRLLTRDKRSFETVSGIFEPLLTAIVQTASDHAQRRFGLAETWDPPEERIVKDALKGIEHRCASWTAENVEEIAQAEFIKVIRGLCINIFREAGAAVVV